MYYLCSALLFSMSCWTCIFICLISSIIFFNVSTSVFCLLRSMAILVNSWISACKLNMSSAVSCSLFCLACLPSHPVVCSACSPSSSFGGLSNPVTFFLNSCTSASKLKISSVASGSLSCFSCSPCSLCCLACSPSRSRGCSLDWSPSGPLGCVDCSPSRSRSCVDCSPSRSLGCVNCSPSRSLICVGCSPSLSNGCVD